MLRYFFPPAFRIPKDDVNSMTAEELVAFPLVREMIDDSINHKKENCNAVSNSKNGKQSFVHESSLWTTVYTVILSPCGN